MGALEVSPILPISELHQIIPANKPNPIRIKLKNFYDEQLKSAHHRCVEYQDCPLCLKKTSRGNF